MGRTRRPAPQRRAEPALQPFEKRQDFLAVFRVEISCRLVGQNQGRTQYERPGHGNPLLFSAGEFVRQVLGSVTQAGSLQHFKRPGASFLAAGARKVERERHVFLRSQSGEQIEELEDEPDLLAAQSGQVVVVQTRRVPPVDDHRALARPVQASNYVQQCRLA